MMAKFWCLLLLSFCNISNIEALLPPSADQRTKDAVVGDKYVIIPDPNDCRGKSATYCCNRIYYTSILIKDQNRWLRYQHDLEELLEGRWKDRSPPPEPVPINWEPEKFNIFEADSMEGPKTQREARSQSGSRAHFGDGMPWFDTFYFSCWFTLSDEIFFALYPVTTTRRREISTRRDSARQSRRLRIQCDTHEKVVIYPESPRRQWERSNPSFYPQQDLHNARCVSITDVEWRQRQHDWQDASTDQMVGSRISQGSYREDVTNAPRRQRAKLLGQNTRIIQSGSTESCLQFPALAGFGDNRWPSGIQNQISVDDAAQQFERSVDQHSIAFVARTTAAATISTNDSDNFVLGTEEAWHRRVAAAEQYNQSIMASSFDTDWDYPELYAEAVIQAEPVQTIDVRVVSRSTGQMYPSVKTIIGQVVGPSSFLSIFDDASSSNTPAAGDKSSGFDQTLQRLQDEPVDTVLEACVTTMPYIYDYGYDDLPITLWTDVLALPGSGEF